MSMHVKRSLEKVLTERLFTGKVLILYGPRQAGKTTLVKRLVEPYGASARFIDCELLENRDLLRERSSEELFSLVKGYKIVVFDEAQVVRGIGSILKSLFDHHPEVQYIATGSSSFDLANVVSEPLTGRSLEFTLYPLGISELAKNSFDAEQSILSLLRFGGYPDIQGEREEEKILRLKTITSQYLYKNVLAVGAVRKPDIITQLLTLLSYQIGHEVSYNELATKLGTSKQTIERYIDLLEKSYVVLRLPSFARNLRNEVTRSKKIYFVDLGIRNALLDSFRPIDTISRPDVGALFENLMIVEHLKHCASEGRIPPARYFWRTFAQNEIDFLEEREGELRAYEFKWNSDAKHSVPKAFTVAYPNTPVATITPRNAYSFITGG